MLMVSHIKTKLYILKISWRYGSGLSSFSSFLTLIIGCLYLPFSKINAAKYLMASHRNCFSDLGRQKRESLLRNNNLLDKEILQNLMPPIKDNPEDIFQKRIIKLKEKTNDERGVILLTYLDTFIRLSKFYDIKKILSDYNIVLELSYYGCCRPEVLQYMQYGNSKAYVGLVEDIEVNFINRLNGNLIPVGFSSSTWVDDRIFAPLNIESKKYDCLMVGTWDPVKRHQILFKAIKKTKDKNYKVALVGVPWGGTRENIERMISYYGLQNNIDIFENVSAEKVNILMNQSKVLVLTSLKEGGNKSIIEAMMADTPIIIVSQHIGINHNWVNEKTGMFSSEENLYEALIHFKNNYDSYSPRKWALENISCKISTAKLEAKIKEVSLDSSEKWIKPLATKVNEGPLVLYYNEDEQLTPFDFDKYKKSTD